MPLRIDRVETDMHVQPAAETAPRPADGSSPTLAGSDTALMERLRPIVLQILDQEMQRLRRQG
jgi:hypothetical protein